MINKKLSIMLFLLSGYFCCYGSQQDSTLTTIQLTVTVENATSDATYRWNAYSTSSIYLSNTGNNSLATNPTIQAFIQQQRRNVFKSEYQEIKPGETQTKKTNITISATDTTLRAILAINNKEHSFSILREAGKDSYLKKFIIGKTKK